MVSLSSIRKHYYSWWKNLDKPIFSIIIILFVTGLFFSLVSTSLVASNKLNTNDFAFFFKHSIFIILGLSIILFLSSIDVNKLFQFSIFMFGISMVLLILVPVIGVEVKGSKRWLDFILLPRFQPVELLKPFFVVIVSLILCSKYQLNLSIKYLISLLVALSVSLLLVIQPDIGQTLLISSCWAILVFVSGINIYFFLIFALLSVLLFLYLVVFIPKFTYIKMRILSFFNSETGTHNFQSDKAIESISSGGFFGKGLGEGILKNKVPEAHTDYIVSVISEEFGVLSIIFILFIFLIFIYFVFKKIRFEDDVKIKLILTGSISLILFQALIHIGVNIRLFPTTGMTLPYLSYGGSSIISVSLLSGIILNLTKRRIS
ncbi:FtsW/RodA/SpoVE family cell cycle protein [Candidatus Pelagibacter sp.]|uniref:FtsW/RodA/SpoVE family cell cycle protein n=1 Tax=Candidatus Pelagibacter sp. TaxID=2024849 RepID=UPI003F85D550